MRGMQVAYKRWTEWVGVSSPVPCTTEAKNYANMICNFVQNAEHFFFRVLYIYHITEYILHFLVS